MWINIFLPVCCAILAVCGGVAEFVCCVSSMFWWSNGIKDPTLTIAFDFTTIYNSWEPHRICRWQLVWCSMLLCWVILPDFRTRAAKMNNKWVFYEDTRTIMITIWLLIFGLIFHAVLLIREMHDTVNKTDKRGKQTHTWWVHFRYKELLTNIISTLQPTHPWSIPYNWGASGQLPSLACVRPVAKDDPRLDESREILHQVRILHHELTFSCSSHLDIVYWLLVNNIFDGFGELFLASASGE